MAGKTWISPDGKIRKIVALEGEWGKKPTEWCECVIKITNCTNTTELKEYESGKAIVIGDTDGNIGRFLDISLITMNENEISNFTIIPSNISFTLELIKFKHNGFIYQWDANKKFEIALKHKERGVELFKDENRIQDAAYRFCKGLKIILSIPIDVANQPDSIDGLSLKEIDSLTCNLYNNLASYYFKQQIWSNVIESCHRVLKFDPDNVKARYKIGVAYMNDKNFDKAKESFEIVLCHEPGNKAAFDNLNLVKEELQKANVKFNDIVKKMFQ